MIRFFINKEKKIGIYHLYKSVISTGKILNITNKYLFLESYNQNNEKNGLHIFLREKIKRIILKSDYIEKLENKKNYSQSFEFLNNEKMTSFNDICEKIIEEKYFVTLKLVNGDIEKGYLVEKISNFYYFNIVNNDLNVISTEIFEKNYIEEIKIMIDDNIIQNSTLYKIKLFSNETYIGNILLEKEDTIIFKKFNENNNIFILKKENIEKIYEMKENIIFDDITKYIQNKKNINLISLLRICFNLNFFIFIDNEKFSKTKTGIIEYIFDDENFELNVFDEEFNFIEKTKINISEIQILQIQNYCLNIKNIKI